MAVEQTPFLGGALGKFEHHGQRSEATAAPFRATMPGTNRRERRLDRIHRAQVPPVLSVEVVERQSYVAVLRQACGRLGMLRLIIFQEGIEAFQGLALGLAPPDLMDQALGFRLFAPRNLSRILAVLFTLAALFFR
jgi:hypothetical protein